MKETPTTSEALVCPEVPLRTRVQELFLLADGSLSMEGAKVAAMNQAVRESMVELLNTSKLHPNVEYRVRSIVFNTDAYWHIGPKPVALEHVQWQDVEIDFCTNTGRAVNMLADAVKVDRMPKRGFPPVMVLLSDGENTDGNAYEKAIARLDKEPWGCKAIRLAIGIGPDYSKSQLELFGNQPEIGVLEARNAVDLANLISYASVSIPLAASVPVSTPGEVNNNVCLPKPPAPVPNSDVDKMEVF